MDLVSMLMFGLMSCAIGAVLMLLVQYYAFVRYFRMPELTQEQQEQCRRSAHSEPYELPGTLLASIKAPDAESKSTIMAINLILQFLYSELRNSNRVRKWFHRKLSLELDELISKTTIGKLFDKLSIRDLDLGSQFPEIKNIRLHNVDLHQDEQHIESLDVLLDLSYEGNFRLAIDADMVLGKKGSLSVKVRQVSGIARLQFTRKPYTHWSLSFVGDPKVDLEVQSQFQGRQMQSNVTSLISNQIRKAIRRKHTLPNYKLRYKPFFHRVDEDYDQPEIPPSGTLEVIVEEITRLNGTARLSHVYCILTLAHMPWVVARQQDDNNMVVSLDLEIHKAKNQQIGIVFKQSDQLVIIEAVIPNTPASKADLKRGDLLLSIQGKRVNTINQVAKIIKALNRPMFILRIERIIPGVIKNDGLMDDLEDYEEIDPNLITFSKNVEAVQIGSAAVKEKTKLSRRSSRDSGGESSLSNTPGTTPVKRLDASKEKKEDAPSRSPHHEPAPKKATFDGFPQHSSVDCEFNSFIRMGDLCSFQLMEPFSYLNLSVFGKSSDEHRLLGYLNIPISSILQECSESHLGHHLKKYPLLPPEAIDVSNHQLSMQSGFDQNYCYGDVLLSFVWTEGSLATASGSTPSMKSSTENIKKLKLITISKGSADKLDEDKPDAATSSETKLVQPPNSLQQQHDFIRTHFHRTTQCDYCGKKIWLKDAVQCRECAMCCHKKCINKCQSSTVCSAGDATQASSITGSGSSQPEFRVTEVDSPTIEVEDFVDIAEEQQQAKSRLESHRQSFSDLLAQGLKRVNSANNLSIPMVSSLNQSSKSLPPTPQHTPRKQSLANVANANPFVVVTQRLEALPDDVKELQMDQIVELTAPLMEYGSSDTLMALAKSSSKIIYAECEPDVRTEKINKLLNKLHVALDCETLNQSYQFLNVAKENGTKLTEKDASSTSASTPSQQQQSDAARSAFLAGQSDERVQALSVIMLHLCSGLQHVQGNLSQ